jgi:hypothetical protein
MSRSFGDERSTSQMVLLTTRHPEEFLRISRFSGILKSASQPQVDTQVAYHGLAVQEHVRWEMWIDGKEVF